MMHLCGAPPVGPRVRAFNNPAHGHDQFPGAARAQHVQARIHEVATDVLHRPSLSRHALEQVSDQLPVHMRTMYWLEPYDAVRTKRTTNRCIAHA